MKAFTEITKLKFRVVLLKDFSHSKDEELIFFVFVRNRHHKM